MGRVALAGAIALAWVLVWGTASLFPKIEVCAKHHAKSDLGEQDCTSYDAFAGSFVWLWDRLGANEHQILAAFTIALAAATAALALYTKRLFQATAKLGEDSAASIETTKQLAAATQKSADIAERSLLASERPYVFLQGFEKVAKLDSTGHIRAWRINPVWENSGTSPTKRLLTHVCAAVLPGEMPDNFAFPDSPGNVEFAPPTPIPGVIGPKAKLLGEDIVIGVVDLGGFSPRKGAGSASLFGGGPTTTT